MEQLRFRVRAIGNDPEAEAYLNQMADDGWMLDRVVPVGEGGRALYIHAKMIVEEESTNESH